MKNAILLLTLLSFLFLSGPVQSQETPTISPTTASTNPYEALATAQSDFGIRFFQEIVKENPGKNVLVSPYSASSALGMVYNGAHGATQEAMANVLGLSAMEVPEVNRENLALQKDLQSTDPDIQLNVANSLWANKRYKIKQDFLKTNELYYGGEVTNLDFVDPASLAQINQWVSDKTKGKIPTIISSLGARDMLVLVNAVYFKGLWTNPFKVEETKPQPFYLLDNTSPDRPMMNQKNTFSYFETDDFQAISLPYGKNDRFGQGSERLSLIVFLPKTGSDLTKFFAELTPENWQAWNGQFHRTEVKLGLPKFKMDFSTGLVTGLTQLGMGTAFNRKADFSRLSARSCYISDAIQKTYMLVDEEGTEAAAATAIVMHADAISMRPLPIPVMTVDHPFFITLVDNQTKTILFAGAIFDPQF